MENIKFNLEVTMPERWMKKFIQMLDCMRWCGNVGASRTLGFYADGDGDFSFNFKFNGWDVEKVQDWEKIDRESFDKDNLKPFQTNRKVNFFFDAG